MFAAAWAHRALSTQSKPRARFGLQTLGRFAYSRTLAAAACLLVVCVAGSAWLHRDPGFREKGAGVVSVQLSAYAARNPGGHPVVDRTLTEGSLVAQDEHIVFRYALSEPAWLYLFSRDRAGVQVLYASAQRLQAGEHEIAAAGQVLALELSNSAGSLEISAVASRSALSDDELTKLKRLNQNDPSPHCDFDACGLDRIRIDIETESP
ncbi:MAG: hypothetical protein H6729_15970 [Deltaproteobacteria bacterium]|nr:hypothetical protein [Deltaproteobacteria bacterium]